ncbi:MAG: hypothetical protein QNJ16_05925 [Rhodobacter sp.]|nr:hypothetical protein [Rhodobacter sp.]
MSYRTLLTTAAATAMLSMAATPLWAPTWHTGAGSIDGSLCIGFDCPSTPAFGFDTLRLQENNLRIHFDDTSTTASFPPNDWRLYANDSANGGSSYFGVEDATAGRFVFRVFAGARSNALTVDSQGDVGLGTTTPALDIDIKTGDTPSVRLQQDGTSGFTPQTWDMAGNEVGFFIRDATGGSQLPFRILVGAPSQALLIDGDGDVGLSAGTNPEAPLHVERNVTGANVFVEDSDGTTEIVMDDGSSGDDFKMQLRDDIDAFSLTFAGTGGAEMVIAKTGDVTIGMGDLAVSGSISSGGMTLNVPDYVFAPDYELMPLNEVEKFVLENRHLPRIPSAAEVKADGLNMTEMQLALLEKIEELTLYVIQQERRIEALEN